MTENKKLIEFLDVLMHPFFPVEKQIADFKVIKDIVKDYPVLKKAYNKNLRILNEMEIKPKKIRLSENLKINSMPPEKWKSMLLKRLKLAIKNIDFGESDMVELSEDTARKIVPFLQPEKASPIELDDLVEKIGGVFLKYGAYIAMPTTHRKIQAEIRQLLKDRLGTEEELKTLDFFLQICQEAGSYKDCRHCCEDNTKNCDYSENMALIRQKLGSEG